MDRLPESIPLRASGIVAVLRRWRVRDADALYRAVSESSRHLRPWLHWVDGYGPRHAAAFLVDAVGRWDRGESFDYAISDIGGPREPSVVLGAVSLARSPAAGRGPGEAHRGAEVGYWLRPDATGRGLATLAAASVVDAAFQLPGVRWVDIVHDRANAASSGVPRRLAFTEVARRSPPQSPVTAGEDGVEVVWRMTREDHFSALQVR
ncbi:RimJ/RimL family protein N-acetyltransferase [Murinocardiopsis flavida]|uniref:RimJ/RimL family protein N-acetyltransferase n=1 Tax=Murinocardiopsis flavida TaxID=645275 RepID=A0A2P8DUB1_9ACTN|nr:GNAT family N-acetyltransferase [Murinocardiopsis flavida]PSL00808.1 RimJ/RimL family protein N-acetyltransferase [Murinocardiopsis flavida]